MHISIMLSNKCNYYCSHCIENSDPHQSERLAPEKITGLIDAAGRLSEAGDENLRISFTGGEPFLHFEDLLLCAAAAKRNNAGRIDCVTNCFWAGEALDAARVLKKASNAGIDHLSFSYDPYHGKFVDVVHLKNAFIAAVENGIRVKFKIVLFKDSERAYDFLKNISDITPGKSFSIDEIPGLPLGRAEKLDKSVFLYGAGIPPGKCQGIGNLLITNTGDVYPCCCPAFSEVLRLGNVHSDSLEDIYKNLKEALHLKILLSHGPGYFIPFLKEQGVDLSNEPYVDTCHLCSAVFKSCASCNSAHNNAIDRAIAAWRQDIQRAKEIAEIFSGFLGDG
ncbi:cyclic pyranopterin monophosphate synthase [Ruminiclostridium hungatei]|uniref:Cyclic pyranopterin monophosphate synthase n=1 Tax=Ruminiclostridium hungatei TaxID=48256 RepID=A0A1V4SPG7_RUMHU|nr:radical SAM protein [Ruminiclostridium hungatei]OPX45161.1 cyclic pyranopterin monophosphate synthase [Ruminiclostridium hungatei]